MTRFALALLVGSGWITAGALAQSTPSGTARAVALQQLQADHPLVATHVERTRVTRLYGAPFGTGVTAQHAAAAFVRNYSAVFGATANELQPGNRFDGQIEQPILADATGQNSRFTLVYYSQTRDGLPVYGGELRLLVRNTPEHALIWAGSSVRDLGTFHVPAGAVAQVAEGDAYAAAMTAVPSLANFEQTEVVVWAGTDDQPAEPTVAVTFIADNYGSPMAQKPERWRFVVDAATNKILYREDQIHFTDITAHVMGMTTDGWTADMCADETATPLPYIRVRIFAGRSGYTDINGTITLTHSGTTPVTVQSPMEGLYFLVSNAAGSTETLSQSVTPPGPADFLHNAANTSEFVRSQVNAYLQANRVRDWLLSYDPTYPTIANQLAFPLNVNRLDGYCPGNAWYDGTSLNFCSAASGYPDTAYGSILYHEYGHHIVACGGSGQGAYGEGMSDCVAMLLVDDPRLGPGFFGDCDGELRNADNLCQYSATSCSSCGSESHDCGQLLAGCVWSVRTYLAASEPNDYLDTITTLTINSVKLHTGTSIRDDILIDFLTLDDVDGDIYNGTPHWEEICSGFADHGFTCPALQAGVSVTPGDDLAATGHAGGPFTPASVNYVVENIGDDPVDYAVTTGATWLTLTNASGTLAGHATVTVNVSLNATASALPNGQYADTLQFVNLTDHYGDTARAVSLEIGTSQLIYNFPMNYSPGWTTEGLWAFGQPTGGGASGADPTSGHTGNFVYGYNLAGDYENGIGELNLTSTALDCTGVTSLRLHFWRWLGVEDNLYDHAYVRVSNDGVNWTTIWQNQDTLYDGAWVAQDFDISAVADNQPTVYLRWTMGATDGSQPYCGWNIDDVEVWGYDGLARCRGDSNCDGRIDFADINAFVGRLIEPGQYAELYPTCPDGNSDLSRDGAVTFGDINPFVDLLTQNAIPIACP